MLRSVAEVSVLTGLSKVSIYNKIKLSMWLKTKVLLIFQMKVLI